MPGARRRRASDRGHVSLAHSAARAGIFMCEQVAFTLLSIVGLLGYLVDMCWPLWDARRQTVHDKLARHRRPRPRAGG